MSHHESADALKKRADRLRRSARDARRAATGLGTLLDGEVRQAVGSPAIWKGPYADRTTGTLKARKAALHRMASDLLADARRWETEADHLDHRARQAAR